MRARAPNVRPSRRLAAGLGHPLTHGRLAGRPHTFVGTPTGVGGTTSPQTLVMPVGLQANDLLLVLARNSAAESIGFAGAANLTALWTLARATPNLMRTVARMYKVNAASPALSVTTATPANGLFATAIGMRGGLLTQVNPESDSYRNSDSSGTNPSFISSVVTGSARLCFAVSFIGGSLAPKATEAGWTRLLSFQSAAGAGGTIVVDVQQSTAAGTVTAPDHYDAIAQAWGGLTLALAPA